MRYNKREIKIPKFNNNEIIRKIIRTVNTEGFYLVLFICFCIVAAATVWTVKVNVDRLENINSLENKNYVQNNQAIIQGQLRKKKTLNQQQFSRKKFITIIPKK